MKFIRFLLLCVFFVPMVAGAANSSFNVAAQLLAAAKAADVQQVQALVNAGADINFVDSTGLSIVCTALMNNDVRAAQILQMYGADASKCDMQIKRYNNRNKPRYTGGLFSGLSSAQSLTLAAAGAAVVAGGLFLLTDVFDPGNENSTGGNNSGERPNQGGSGSGGTGGATAMFTVPYGPAYLENGKINTSSQNFADNLKTWNPEKNDVRAWDFNYFRPNLSVGADGETLTAGNFLVDGIMVPMQNYLLMMHGYAAFANGYMGKRTYRDANKNPVSVLNAGGGGVPISVFVVTDNGVNPTGSATRGGDNEYGIEYALSASEKSEVLFVDKYLNYANPVSGVLGAEKTGFDLSGAGTAMNPFASAYDSALGKIIAGWEKGGRSYGDLYGFVPNGRLGVIRTGAGKEWVSVENPADAASVGSLEDVDGSKADVINVGDKIVLNGVTYQVSLAVSDSAISRPTITINGTKFDVAVDSTLLKGTCVAGTDEECENVSDIAIYSDDKGNYYFNTIGGNNADAVYMVNGGNLYVSKTLENADYKIFEGLYNALGKSVGGNGVGTNYGVIANLSVLDSARDTSYVTVADMPQLISLGEGNATGLFGELINFYYDKNENDDTTQGGYANRLFNAYGMTAPIMVMPAGDYKYGIGEGMSLRALDATFENYAPLLYDSNLKNNFMTVVAVRHEDGTSAADSIQDYGNGTGSAFGKLLLSKWTDANGTDTTDDDVVYSSRQCGITGVGQGNINPWCFAAAGATAEMAAASAAGAVASVKAAFDYMSNKDVFYLLALTADGYLLGADSNGAQFTQETLASYLRNMYSLPPEQYEDMLTSKEYLDAFARVYGYGLINLDRAMKPNHTIYYFDGNKIVSADGNAFWRAATNTDFRPSAVLNLRGASVRAPFYDVVESVDGKISMPRVWKNEFAFGHQDKRGLYMGDVLGDLKTRKIKNDVFSVGKIDFSMSFSDRAYVDYLNGLDNLKFAFNQDDWQFAATYQQKLTDELSQFDSMVNPILGLTSNAVTADVKYAFGDFSVGTRLFSGAITEEGLLENDPTVSSQYMPAKLGLAQGGQAEFVWDRNDFVFDLSVGVLMESNTLLGAYSNGLLDLGNGKTTYLDFVAGYDFSDDMAFNARATLAKTNTENVGSFVLGLTDLTSNSFAIAANVGNFEFSLSQPLAIVDGEMSYAYADYSVQEQGENLELNVGDMYVEKLNLKPEKREVRFSAAYRHNFGEFTDGAFGFIYRVNPNHTDEFGNESIFMLKMTHRLGI